MTFKQFIVPAAVVSALYGFAMAWLVNGGAVFGAF
jgi:hypothetical protein